MFQFDDVCLFQPFGRHHELSVPTGDEPGDESSVVLLMEVHCFALGMPADTEPGRVVLGQAGSFHRVGVDELGSECRGVEFLILGRGLVPALRLLGNCGLLRSQPLRRVLHLKSGDVLNESQTIAADFASKQ